MVYKPHAHLTLVTKYQKTAMTDRITDKRRSTFEEVCGRHDLTPDTSKPTTTILLVSYPRKSRSPLWS